MLDKALEVSEVGSVYVRNFIMHSIQMTTERASVTGKQPVLNKVFEYQNSLWSWNHNIIAVLMILSYFDHILK